MITPYYDEGGITIFHAACEDVLPSLAAASVSLVIADPPYGIKENTKRGSSGRVGNYGRIHKGTFVSRDWSPIVGDDVPFEPAHLLRFPRIVLFGANHYAQMLPPSPSWIVWDKREGGTPDDNADCEMAWTNLGGPARLFSHLWRGVCRRSEAGKAPLHPTQKPVALMRWIIERWTKPDDLVLDPYMGSGPIAQACKETGRRYIGIEIEQQYVDVAVSRLQQEVMHLW